jgi:hypothetical protein
MFLYRLILLLTIIYLIESAADWSNDEYAEKWNMYSRLRLEKSLNRKLNGNVAKNIIFFLGDGMGINI